MKLKIRTAPVQQKKITHRPAADTSKKGSNVGFQPPVQKKGIAGDEQLSSYANGANVPPFADSPDVAQCMKVAGVTIRPTGESGRELWKKVSAAMISNNMSPHGAQKVFQSIVKTNKTDYLNDDHFIGDFLQAAGAEIKRVEDIKKSGDDSQSRRGWTRPLKLNRPTWSQLHKMGGNKGEDIRHVVRNATILKALQAEYDFQKARGLDKAQEVFSDLAVSIGISSDATHPWQLLKKIYVAAYSNFGNLFRGPGAINRVIGLTADRIIEMGMTLKGKGDEPMTPEGIEEVFDWLVYQVASTTDSTEAAAEKVMGGDTLEIFVEGLEEFFDEICDFAIDREDVLAGQARQALLPVGDDEMGELPVLSESIGNELLDIGYNFGFDVPNFVISKDHMEVLLMTEEVLGRYEGGNADKLKAVLMKFMELANILNAQ